MRATAAAALAPSTEAAHAALRAGLTAPDPQARVAALDGVTALPDGADLAAQAAAVPTEAVRARAAWMLASLKEADAVEKLTSDVTAGVRAEALRALASLDAHRASRLADHALSDPSLAVRLAALSALARGGDRARLVALAGGAGGDRWVALRAAVQLKDGATLAVIEAAAADPHAALRVAALNAAGELGERGQKIAQSLLGDRDLEVRLAAARALISAAGDSGAHKEAAQRVLLALNTPYRLEAADELARLGQPAGRRLLARPPVPPEASARRSALYGSGLARHRRPRARSSFPRRRRRRPSGRGAGAVCGAPPPLPALTVIPDARRQNRPDFLGQKEAQIRKQGTGNRRPETGNGQTSCCLFRLLPNQEKSGLFKLASLRTGD